jgi:hypothetical protein
MSRKAKTTAVTIRHPLSLTFEAAEVALNLMPATRLKDIMRERKIPIPKHKFEMVERILDSLDYEHSEVVITIHPVPKFTIK